jgi:hypothetical protein
MSKRKGSQGGRLTSAKQAHVTSCSQPNKRSCTLLPAAARLKLFPEPPILRSSGHVGLEW